MSSFSKTTLPKRPIIGCTTYRKEIGQLSVVGINSAYTEAVLAAGGIPILIPLGLDEQGRREVFERIDGLLLPGGGDLDYNYYSSEQECALRGIDLERDELEIAMTKAAVVEYKPFLAICRGHQVMNVALGGTLWQDVKSQMPGAIRHDFRSPHPRNYLAHRVEISPGSKLAQYLPGSSIQVNSIHHQGIKELAPGLEVSARADDGLIEGIELPDHPFAVGVQWHPEGMVTDDPSMLQLFKGLVDTAVKVFA